jgi:hypothetical protein
MPLMSKPVLKTLTFSGLEVKDDDKGEVGANFATLGVVDKDGDIIRKGALPKGAKAAMSRWGHDAIFGERPVGKGPLAEEGNQLKFAGKMFLNTWEGRETFETLKEMGPDQEWSFGFRVAGWENPSDEERKQVAVRIITKMEPVASTMFEVSPVLAGAGVGTRTTAVKSVSQADGTADAEQKDPELEAIANRIYARVADEMRAERKAAEDAAAAAEDARAQAERADAEAKATQAAEAARQAAEQADAEAKAKAEADAKAAQALIDLAAKELERFMRTSKRVA